jgi:hypothetical protein
MAKPPEYVFWNHDSAAGTIDKIDPLGAQAALVAGKPVDPKELAEVKTKVRERFNLETDSIRNFNKLVIVSDRLKAFLEAAKVPSVEFLPIAIAAATKLVKYHVMNVLDPIDCIDQEKLDDDEKFVFVAARTPPNRPILRVVGYDRHVLVTKELAAAIDEAGFTGIAWVPTKSFHTM